MQSTADQIDKQLIDKQLIDAAHFQTHRRPGSLTDVELPAGWLLRQRVQPSHGHVLEVFDAQRDLVGLVASAGRALVSIDSTWWGYTAHPDPERRCWSLAMGHVVGDTDALVTFIGRNPDGRLGRTTVTPTVVDGLWIAMVSARMDVVALHQRTHHCMRRIVFRGCA